VLLRTDAPLAPLTTLGIGGSARRLVTAYDEAEIVAAVRAADQAGEDLLILGGGSNLVLPDGAFEGTVVRVLAHGLRATRDGDRVLLEAAAGEDWDGFVALCVADRLVGVECLSGIPGLVGGTPVQNVGAYGQEVAQTVTRVRAYDRDAGEVVELDAAQCRFTYRHSVFKGSRRHVVLAVQFALEPGDLSAPVRYGELARALGVEVGERAPLDRVRAAVLALRRGKGMVVDPADPDSRSAGSFFTNPLLSPAEVERLRGRVAERLGEQVLLPTHPEPDGRSKVSAAWLIEHSGFAKGWGEGPVGLSTKHVLALVNRGGARSEDLRRAAREVREGVRAAFGVELVPEPVLLAGPL
jgi:UDP-N-acetylmuramate dehydrogenase